MNIQIADYISNSLVNGEGIRDVIFFSGCQHRCEGCHNQAAWDFQYGDSLDIDYIVSKVLEDKELIDGVTISGGDPFYQYGGLLELCKTLKKHNINVWVYTGFYYEQLRDMYGYEIFKYIDVLVEGEFIQEIREEDLKEGVGLKYRGSSNQDFCIFDEDGIYKKEVFYQ